jgi:hypothetical protein
MNTTHLFDKLYAKCLLDDVRVRFEKLILIVSIVSFIIHLIIIYLVDFEIMKLSSASDLLKNPIAAIYTPFSFILLYEVYLLIFYLPKSFTTYIGKQYEIITLIIIRRLFKDLANLDLQGDWFKIKYDLQFTYDLVTSIIMFSLIYLFYKQSKIKISHSQGNEMNSIALEKFIKIKKGIALLLLPFFIILTIGSFTIWVIGDVYTGSIASNPLTNINNIFFEQFFSILIFADVLLLLFSFFITDEFHKVVRNSGFIISTILIRISFSTTGLTNNILILSSIIFGLLILYLHNKFENGVLRETTHPNGHD